MTKATSFPLLALLVLSAFLVVANPSAVSSDTCTTTYNLTSNVPAQQLTISNPGTYCFDAGTYNTQISITSSNVALTAAPGTKADQAIIEPSSVVVNNYMGYFGVYPQAAIILAGISGGDNLVGVSVSNLVINGAAGSPSLDNYPVCTTDYAGINYNGASGSISNNVVENMYLPVDQAGCANGGGIDGDTNNAGPAETITITHNIVPNYGEFGIACFGSGVDCNMADNSMPFYAAYASLSKGPAGIAVLGGSVGIVDHNTISGNMCTDEATVPTCGPNLLTQTQGAGIFTLASGAGTVLRDNVLIDNDVGISVVFDVVSVTNNLITGSSAAAIEAYSGTGIYRLTTNVLSQSAVGIALIQSSGIITGNTAKDAGTAFELIESSGNTLVGNTAINGITGYYLDSSSSNNRLVGNTANGNSESGFYLAGSSGNTLIGNAANHNSLYGYVDLSSGGTGTGGVTSLYQGDECNNNGAGGSSPAGLCTPQH
jgi:parallel beta-helix repeat protein